jgi:hypothetical protein
MQQTVRTQTPGTSFFDEYSSGALDRIFQILRGEIAAVEAYEHVLQRFSQEPGVTRLEEIKRHHEAAVTFWNHMLADRGIAPKRGSGPWGQVVKTFVDTAQLFGDTASLRALLAGESHGLSEYHELLMDSTVPPVLKDKVRETFIPLQEQHIELIEAWKGV